MISSTQPTPAQKRWMDLGFGMFVHFGINTFYDLEWSDGTLDQSAFNPTDFNPDEWCETAQKAGMKFLVLVTKHHDGFCLWPTQQTNYSVQNTPFGRDVVGEVVQAARRHGLEVGIYYSLWDRHEPSHDRDDAAYSRFMLAQLSELLTNYGEIVEVWFDGMWAKLPNDWKTFSEDEFLRAWREVGAPRWGFDEIYARIKELQPGCLVLNNTTTEFPGLPLFPCDARPGEKATEGEGDRNVWTWNEQEHFLPLQIETTMSQSGPPGMFASGSWFWHEWDKTAASPQRIRDWLQTARRKNAVLLLNCGPDNRGRLRPEDIASLSNLQ